MTTKMPISFAAFRQACQAHGYQAIKQEETLFYVRTKNSVKHEVKYIKKHGVVFVIGYGRKEEEIDSLKIAVQNQNLPILNTSKKCLFVPYTNMEDFFMLASMIEDIDGLVARSYGLATKVFSKEVDEINKFEKIAGRYFYAIQNEDQELLDLARGLLSGDSIDHLLSRGESIEHTEKNSYREHIVPCIMIHNEAIRMVLAGSSKAEVAQMISTNLAIVRITPKQAKLLDIKLRLKTTMPNGWNFGDCVFARLTAAGIKLK